MNFEKETPEQQENPQGNEDAENVLPAPTSDADAVFRVFVDTRKPMKAADVQRELAASPTTIPSEFRDMSSSTIRELIRKLANNYDNVLEGEPYQPYIIHPDWNGKPLEEQKKVKAKAIKQQRQVKQASSGLPLWSGQNPKDKFVIPCYGVRWDRELICWDKTTGSLFGRAYDDRDKVDFADQVGVYILYDMINLIYVGRTASEKNKGLYSRLKSHSTNERRADRWTHFSWFGLRVVDEENNKLAERRRDLNSDDETMLMETLLIETHSPPYNDKSGDNLGIKYEQVIDPVIHDRNTEQLKKDIREMLPGLMNDSWTKIWEMQGRSK